jgi:transposase
MKSTISISGHYAMMYTLVENCKRHGLDPYGYLRDVLTELPEGEPGVEEVAHLTPASIAGARRRSDRSSVA